MTTRKRQHSPILVTGAAGFIGFHTAIRLLERGERVIGLDNVNDYYDVRLKKARLAKLKPLQAVHLHQTRFGRPSENAAPLFHAADRGGGSFGGASGCALFAGEPACLYGQQHRRVSEYIGRLPACEGRAPRLCLVEFCLWRQYADAVLDS